MKCEASTGSSGSIILSLFDTTNIKFVVLFLLFCTHIKLSERPQLFN